MAVSEESLPLSISATGPTSQRTMEQHYQLGYINARLTKYPEAIAHYKSAIGILERRGKNLDTAILLNYVGHYATSLQLMGQIDSVVALRSTYLGYARAGYGANSLDYADYVYDLGRGQADQKDMVNAEKNVTAALLIYEKRLDSTDYRIGYAVASLYSILLDQGKTAEAAVYKERAEAVKRDQE